MTSIYDIPHEDIEEFLLTNNKTFKNDTYEKALILLKDRKAIGHTINIIEWMMAHNLIVKKVNIPNYNINELNKMDQNEINQLAKLLNMNGNNVENIKNILRYLHKLNDVVLDIDINNTILQTLNELEIKDIDFETLTPSDIITLLKTYHNKALIRKSIYNNMENIIFYNFLDIDVKRLDNLNYINNLAYNLKYPSYIILKLINDNKEKLVKNFTIDTVDSEIEFLYDDGGLNVV